MYKPKEWIEYSMLRSVGLVLLGLAVTLTVVLLARVIITSRRTGGGGAGGVGAALYHPALHH